MSELQKRLDALRAEIDALEAEIADSEEDARVRRIVREEVQRAKDDIERTIERTRPVVIPQPYPVQPWPWHPRQPWWDTTTTWTAKAKDAPRVYYGANTGNTDGMAALHINRLTGRNADAARCILSSSTAGGAATGPRGGLHRPAPEGTLTTWQWGLVR